MSKKTTTKRRSVNVIAYCTKSERTTIAKIAQKRDLTVSTLMRQLLQREVALAGSVNHA